MLSSQQIRNWILEAGFSACGFAPAQALSEAKARFVQSIDEGRHADMRFLERDVDKRFDPQLLLPDCQSVIVATYPYLIEAEPRSDRYRTARYTWMEDYHVVVKTLLDGVVAKIMVVCPEAHCRVTVDSSCISEKNWAVEAGVGCYGKNGLIHNDHGSFFVIGLILTDLPLDYYNSPLESDCGDCRLCVEKCPAKALETPYRVDARQCYAYQTVENKVPEDEVLRRAPLVFGCDVCQEVCPKNKKISAVLPNNPKTSLFLHLQNEEWESLSREDFQHYFGNTAIARRKYDRFYHAIQIRTAETE